MDLKQALFLAEQMREAGNRDGALAQVREILAEHGSISEAHEIGARCHLAARRWKEAIAEAEAALRTSPTGLEARRIVGVAKLKNSDLPGALQAFDELIAAAPDLPHGWFWRGVTLRIQNKHKDARAALLEALTRQDDTLFVDALSELAILDVFSARPRQSVSSAISAVELAPESATAHRALAICRYETGRYGGALEALDDARRLSPESDWNAWLNARYRARFGRVCSWFRGWARSPFAVESWRSPSGREVALLVSLLALPLTLPVLGILQFVNNWHAESRYGVARSTVEVDAGY